MGFRQVYLLLNDDEEELVWCDIVMFLDREKAKEASKKHPNMRVEIFQEESDGTILPTNLCFTNGNDQDC